MKFLSFFKEKDIDSIQSKTEAEQVKYGSLIMSLRQPIILEFKSLN